jgi:DnaJ-class molecular chaperone
MAAPNLYSILGVARNASADDIKKAYRKLAQKFHPDKNPGDKKAEERFKEISVAHDALSDPEKRALYDEFGMEGLQPGFDPARARAYRQRASAGPGAQSFDWGAGAGSGPWAETSRGGFGDILNELFGHLGRQARGVPGADLEYPVTISMLDAIRGRSITLTLERQVPCSSCGATGRIGPRPCARCGGAGAVPERLRLTVKIPPGVDTGSRVRVAGKGEPGQFGGQAGDLYLAVTVLPHPHLERQGQDLYLNLPITVGEAVLGATVMVPTPGGKVKLKVPSGSQSGRVLRLRGAGIQKGQSAGDFFVRLLIHVPTNGAASVKEAVDTLERAYKEDPRRDLEL